MQIDEESIKLITKLRFITAARGGGRESQMLDFLCAKTDTLPEGLDALVFCSDLQGVVPNYNDGGAYELLGIQVAEQLLELSDSSAIPNAARTGIVLAGDLYSAPAGDKRGASGDVRDVWEAFAASHKWVVGVAGNHDNFGSEREEERFFSGEAMDNLDGVVVERDGLTIAGVGLIVGNPAKAGRREEEEFFTSLELIVESKPDILVLHQGPQLSRTQRGNPHVSSFLQVESSGLVVCGHVHWDAPLGSLDNGRQILNVDSRVVIVTRG